MQSPGIDSGEPPENLEEMASAYIEAIRSIQPHGPDHLGGWSLGVGTLGTPFTFNLIFQRRRPRPLDFPDGGDEIASTRRVSVGIDRPRIRELLEEITTPGSTTSCSPPWWKP